MAVPRLPRAVAPITRGTGAGRAPARHQRQCAACPARRKVVAGVQGQVVGEMGACLKGRPARHAATSGRYVHGVIWAIIPPEMVGKGVWCGVGGGR